MHTHRQIELQMANQFGQRAAEKPGANVYRKFLIYVGVFL